MDNGHAALGLTPKAIFGRLAVIGAILLGAAGVFAYTGGWLSPHRLTPDLMIAALSDRGGNPLGHRRNHSKGTCFTGTFEASGAGARLSTAPMFVAGSYPVIGRFAIAIGDPNAADANGRVRSMAIRIVAPDGQEWRSGMNDTPMFVVATPQAFYELTLTQDIDPATGKPNAAATEHFFATHPEAQPFAEWAKTAPWTDSWADQTYNSLNAFRFVNADGQSQLVRWSMQHTVPEHFVDHATLTKLGPDFLAQDIEQRLAQRSLSWHLVARSPTTRSSQRAPPPTRGRSICVPRRLPTIRGPRRLRGPHSENCWRIFHSAATNVALVVGGHSSRDAVYRHRDGLDAAAQVSDAHRNQSALGYRDFAACHIPSRRAAAARDAIAAGGSAALASHQR
jgi:catalase